MTLFESDQKHPLEADRAVPPARVLADRVGVTDCRHGCDISRCATCTGPVKHKPALAPAVANAEFVATRIAVRRLPLRLLQPAA